MSIPAALKKYWGFDSLRPMQAEAVQASLSNRDCLVVMPTGGGKSLCYQLPAIVSGELTLVVSPLIALMKDQVDALKLLGYPAEAMHSNLSSQELDEIEMRVRNGEIKLLYTSPERVLTSSMIALLRAADQGRGIKRIAIDEAHCISNWGHDFRPEYRQLAKLRELFPTLPVQALTATATPRVREDIVAQLSFQDPEILVGRFDRPNLTYRVVPKDDAAAQIHRAVAAHPNDASIVYCISRKDTEKYAKLLKAKGVNAAAYHAGLDADKRRRISEKFAREQINVVVATVAFGMGIDRANVRCVIHESMPRSIEAYQQETGRAGRDGIVSECLTLYNPGDFMKWKRLITMSSAPDRAKIEVALLDEVRKFASSQVCRHKFLTEYFGQDYSGGESGCEACDLCLEGWQAVPDSTRKAQQIMVTVLDLEKLHGTFTFSANHIAYILTGANRAELRERNHQDLRGYGAMREFSAPRIVAWIGQIIDLGYLSRDPQFGSIRMTNEAREILRLRAEILMRDIDVPEKRVKGAKAIPAGVHEGLFEHLRAWRRDIAVEQSVPAYTIFHDATLMTLAAQRPDSVESLATISGIGDAKIAKFGEEVIAQIDAYCAGVELARNVGVAPIRAVVETGTDVSPTATALRLAPYFAAGEPISTICDQAGLAPSTVGGYLADWVRANPTSRIFSWVDPDTYDKIVAAYLLHGDGRLKPIFVELEQQIPYDQIRIAVAHYQANALTAVE